MEKLRYLSPTTEHQDSNLIDSHVLLSKGSVYLSIKISTTKVDIQ